MTDARRGELEVRPVTPDRWDDLVDLFTRPGPRGGKTEANACWCMFWRLEAGEFERKRGTGERRGAGNRKAMRSLVEAGREPGLLAYLDGVPVGWCSVAPRAEFIRLERSRSLRRVDDEPVWSIVCFYIHRAQQGSGLGKALLSAAVEYAAARGARIVEGYPVRPGDSDPYTGFQSMFEKAGFEMVREGGRRSIMRYRVPAA